MSHPVRRLHSLHIRQGHPDFLDLPWELPLEAWPERSPRVVEVPRGLSRHVVVFISYGATIYAFKETPARVAQREYDLLRGLEERRLPSVVPVGLAVQTEAGGESSAPDDRPGVLITQYLASSLPYRALFMHQGLERYRSRLLDAMAGLLVRLHLGGFFWGDCSLSNVLFRRDAGELQAYAVDAETSELHEQLSSGQREMDLQIMEENVAGGLADLAARVALPEELEDWQETATSIRQRYERLWAEINRELILQPHESYRIHERIRTLNDLGFSVGEVELLANGQGSQLRMRTIVTDREYHRHQLHTLTGIVAEERQASLLLNEMQEMKATLTRKLDRSVPLSVAAFRWLDERYHPTLSRLQKDLGRAADTAELYCQVLEHKWFLSERAKRDVGLDAALQDYVTLNRKQPGIAPLLEDASRAASAEAEAEDPAAAVLESQLPPRSNV
ncbi:DUF4032 domain-containing protein [Corallococcus praedator]|uniref:DUF4032 domain-containing protein n=1 Tax=Corallococcus praedator TaxID=2316724 RepID=A0ABX9QLK5_9BACT|nr:MULTISPECIES: DUF4032 domain-containing protein [Corallococcus]RKH31271.1 DUF4032 domain-containing protein [Corallococcus sp. CA031C]RKI12175.1 DUF4032 domain-containing protein [Corallococcus praedator]